jgi:hypothetical protein
MDWELGVASGHSNAAQSNWKCICVIRYCITSVKYRHWEQWERGTVVLGEHFCGLLPIRFRKLGKSGFEAFNKIEG